MGIREAMEKLEHRRNFYCSTAIINCQSPANIPNNSNISFIDGKIAFMFINCFNYS